MEVSNGAEETCHRKFALPVDSEHKSTEFRLFSVAAPHMRAFHLSWISFFACFVSSLAAPPLLPVIRENLGLTATDIGNAGIAAVSGAVFARIAMGTACDLVGPRLASASLTLLTAPAVYCTAIANSPTSFLLSKVVGTANGVAGGWGNLGGGATQLIMPLVFNLIERIGAPQFTAWRIAFFVPGLFQTLSAYGIFFLGQDLPDGNYSQLHKSGDKHKDSFKQVLYHAVTNYRGWILALTYGYCFGVELTIDNIIAQYFYDRFNVSLHTAGIIAASFGLANLFSRPGGGILSDIVAKRYGMRGRLWTLWTVQTLGGVFCVLLGKVGSLGVSVAVMLIFSVFVQAACGLTFGVAPFVTRVHIRDDGWWWERGGGSNSVIMLIHFPQWGGMFCGPSSKGATEEDYYLSEWTVAEQDRGFHTASLKFSENSRNERGKPAPTPTLATPNAYV
ncbi:hypothetical protein SASPL_110641 [Salvia splendens]|uniref:MFS transporter, NNP family, nitrate/nitrite transporter n=1 Tax=Salvia splendens TaxID=180675 RepID=A0A8X9A2X3_SALSN|nr:hypothetical protein SASPL_110641 [Salvia splendens]